MAATQAEEATQVIRSSSSSAAALRKGPGTPAVDSDTAERPAAAAAPRASARRVIRRPQAAPVSARAARGEDGGSTSESRSKSKSKSTSDHVARPSEPVAREQQNDSPPPVRRSARLSALGDQTGNQRASGQQQRTASSPHKKCKGFKLKDKGGGKCCIPAKPGYDYCCSQHDPQLAHITPATFTKAGLRRDKSAEILRLWDRQDIYADAPLPLHGNQQQLDHIWERQCLSYALARVSEQYQDRWDRSGELNDALTSFVCEVANENDNLAFTRTSINKLKGKACWKFLDDTLTGHRAPDRALHSYLLAAHTIDLFDKTPLGQRVRLQRQETKRICDAMGNAVKICQRKIDDESDCDVVWESYSAQLQRMYVDMQLK